MKHLAIAALAALLAAPASAACNPDDIVTRGSTAVVAKNGEPLVTLKGVGGVHIIRRHVPPGYGDGHLANVTRVCDPEAARAIRRELTGSLNGARGGRPVYGLPNWLENR